jgi:hypothetical protein
MDRVGSMIICGDGSGEGEGKGISDEDGVLVIDGSYVFVDKIPKVTVAGSTIWVGNGW